MAGDSETESDEDKIWNYKSLAKEKTKPNRQVTVQENISGRTCVKQRRQSCHSLKKNDTDKYGKLFQGKDNLKSEKTCKQDEARFEAEVIDVELETDCEFVSQKVTLAKNNTNKMIQNKNLGMNKNKTKVNSSSADHKLNSMLFSKKTASPSKKSKNKLTHSKTSCSTKDSALSSQNKSVFIGCHNIHKYFSPSKEKKRKSSESVDSLFNFTEDELTFVREEKTDSFNKEKVKIPLKISDATSDKDFNCQTKNYGVNKTMDSFFIKEEMALCLESFSGSWDNHLGQKECVNTYVICNNENVISCENTDISAACFDKVNITTPSSDEVGTPHKCCITLEGGFLVEKDFFDIESCPEGHKMRDRHEIQNFSSSNESSSGKLNSLSSESGKYTAAGKIKSSNESSCEKFNLLSLESSQHTAAVEIKSSNESSCGKLNLLSSERSQYTSAVEVKALKGNFNQALSTDDKHNVGRKSSFAAEELLTSTDKEILMTTPRKQTSIFSFFKAQYGSNSKTSRLPTNKNKTHLNSPHSKLLQNNHSKILARPDLQRRNTVTVLSPALKATESQNLFKSASVSSFEKQPEVEQEEQPQTNARHKKPCPFYKRIPNTSITVDAFSYGVIPGCQAYFLTHFHYDHYGGLTKRFAQPIFCSQVTSNLVEHRLGVDKKWINPLPLWKPCQVAGVTLTLMEANHCPGAVMILFELKDGRKIVHTGDFRACPDMQDYPMLKAVVTSELYLDTTYCDPSYTFPTQSEVINLAVSLALTFVAENPETLIVCGTYTIGKEKIFTAIAQALDSKICVTRDKKKVLDCLEDKELKSRLTLDWSAGQVHVLPMNKLNQKGLFEHLACNPHFKTVLAFEPTGWTYKGSTSLEKLSPKWSKNGVTFYGLPYSEHSSFLELKYFIQFLRPKKIIPTVNNGNPASRKKMEVTFSQWMREDLGSNKSSNTTSQQKKLNHWISS